MRGHQIHAEIVDNSNNRIGTLQIRISESQDRIVVDQIYLDEVYQQGGIAKQIFSYLYKHAPNGAKISLFSDNDPSNVVLTKLLRPIKKTRGITGTPEDIKSMQTKLLNQSLLRSIASGEKNAPPFYKVLRDSGWVNIEVRESSDVPNYFIFTAQKP